MTDEERDEESSQKEFQMAIEIVALKKKDFQGQAKQMMAELDGKADVL